MSTQSIINYYANLLILQYNGLPKATATIEATAELFVMDELPTQVLNGFSLDTAVGVQLDILGQYIGVSRNGFTISGPITLNDTQFRSILKIMAIRNQLASDQGTIQNFINTYFSGVIQEFDHTTMRMSYFYLAVIGTNIIAEYFIMLGALPKPMGVQMALVTYAQPRSNFFGFRTYYSAGQNIEPFNDYSSYQLTWPWLSYKNGIVT